MIARFKRFIRWLFDLELKTHNWVERVAQTGPTWKGGSVVLHVFDGWALARSRKNLARLDRLVRAHGDSFDLDAFWRKHWCPDPRVLVRWQFLDYSWRSFLFKVDAYYGETCQPDIGIEVAVPFLFRGVFWVAGVTPSRSFDPIFRGMRFDVDYVVANAAPAVIKAVER